jgi:hypothetical protein
VTDRVTQAYLDDETAHGVMGRLDLPPHLEAVHGHRLVDRPFFLDEYTAHDVAADMMDLFELLFTLPKKLFDGSFTRFAEALGIAPEETALLGSDRPPMHGRADIHRVGDDFRLLELNAGPQLAGVDLGELSHAIHREPGSSRSCASTTSATSTRWRNCSTPSAATAPSRSSKRAAG